jgi:hypothetical protein
MKIEVPPFSTSKFNQSMPLSLPFSPFPNILFSLIKKILAQHIIPHGHGMGHYSFITKTVAYFRPTTCTKSGAIHIDRQVDD